MSAVGNQKANSPLPPLLPAAPHPGDPTTWDSRVRRRNLILMKVHTPSGVAVATSPAETSLPKRRAWRSDHSADRPSTMPSGASFLLRLERLSADRAVRGDPSGAGGVQKEPGLVGVNRGRTSSPRREKLQPVLHMLSCAAADEPHDPPQFLADGVLLLRCNDNARVSPLQVHQP